MIQFTADCDVIVFCFYFIYFVSHKTTLGCFDNVIKSMQKQNVLSWCYEFSAWMGVSPRANTNFDESFSPNEIFWCDTVMLCLDMAEVTR